MTDDIDKAWFRNITDHDQVKSIDDRIDRALKNLARLSAILRSSFALHHARVAEHHRERKEDRQARIEYIAAVFLVPSLVVGFYGANTQLPGRDSWVGFMEMLGALVLLTAVAVLGVWWMNRDES